MLSRKQPKWVIAAELVETNRLWARTLASVQPEWAETIGKHLTKYSYGEPRWDARSGRAVVGERVTLYGLPIVTNRTIGYDRVDAAEARTMFIRHALVEGDWTSTHDFIKHNAEFLDDLRSREDRTRKLEAIGDEAVIAFYDQRVDSAVVSSRHFDRWWKDARRGEPELLTMTAEALGRASDNDANHYPTTWAHADMVFPVTYRFDPGAADDGVTVHVPLAVLGRLTTDGFDWQVPGFRADLVGALMQTLPKDIRRQLIPAAETTAAAYLLLEVADEPLAVALARAVEAVVPSVRVPPRAFDATRVPDHLRITFAVHDETDVVVGIGKDLNEIKRQLRATLRAAVARATPVDERRGITTWDVGDLPRRVDTLRGGHTVRGYPALLDDGDSVSLRVFTTAELQERVMRGGVKRLLLLAVPVGKRVVETHLANRDKLMLARFAPQTANAIATDCIAAVADRLVAEHGEVWTDSSVRLAGRHCPSTTAVAIGNRLAHGGRDRRPRRRHRRAPGQTDQRFRRAERRRRTATLGEAGSRPVRHRPRRAPPRRRAALSQRHQTAARQAAREPCERPPQVGRGTQRRTRVLVAARIVADRRRRPGGSRSRLDDGGAAHQRVRAIAGYQPTRQHQADRRRAGCVARPGNRLECLNAPGVRQQLHRGCNRVDPLRSGTWSPMYLLQHSSPGCLELRRYPYPERPRTRGRAC